MLKKRTAAKSNGGTVKRQKVIPLKRPIKFFALDCLGDADDDDDDDGNEDKNINKKAVLSQSISVPPASQPPITPPPPPKTRAIPKKKSRKDLLLKKSSIMDHKVDNNDNSKNHDNNHTDGGDSKKEKKFTKIDSMKAVVAVMATKTEGKVEATTLPPSIQTMVDAKTLHLRLQMLKCIFPKLSDIELKQKYVYHNQVPGPMPHTINRSNSQHIFNSSTWNTPLTEELHTLSPTYYVAEKYDGQRFLLLLLVHLFILLIVSFHLLMFLERGHRM